MHGVRNIPEPQIGIRQRPMQRLRARHRNQTLLVGAAEKNGNPHQRFRLDPDPLDFPV